MAEETQNPTVEISRAYTGLRKVAAQLKGSNYETKVLETIAEMAAQYPTLTQAGAPTTITQILDALGIKMGFYAAGTLEYGTYLAAREFVKESRAGKALPPVRKEWLEKALALIPAVDSDLRAGVEAQIAYQKSKMAS